MSYNRFLTHSTVSSLLRKQPIYGLILRCKSQVLPATYSSNVSVALYSCASSQAKSWPLTISYHFKCVVDLSFILLLSIFCFLTFGGYCYATPSANLKIVNQLEAPRVAKYDESLWDDRLSILRGVEASIEYLRSPQAKITYQKFEDHLVSRDLVEQSLVRFYDILRSSLTPEEVDSAVDREFAVYRSTGLDGHGSVKFTGYFQPSYQASRHKNTVYKYPIYYLPPDFEDWEKPHPTRIQLEGYAGMGGASTLLDGYEMAFLKNRFDAFIIHLQGSAILDIENEGKVSIGFAAGTAHPFKGIPSDFLKRYNVSWGRLDTFFSSNPDLFNSVISKNNRFVFFQEKQDLNPIGCLGIPVVAGRSIATDKSRFPPGALGLIHTQLPKFSPSGRVELQKGYRLVLDHDTGSAIKGAGRVDLYVGAGPQAQRLASNIYGYGELYYLLLKNSPRIARVGLSNNSHGQG